MALPGLIPLVLYTFLQAVPGPLLQGDTLNAEEKARLDRAQKVDDRIKVYHAASKRMQQQVHASVSAGDFSDMPDALELWGGLLSGSLQDIETNMQAKKKSKALIKFEIQVRKTIAEFKGYKARAPLEQQDAFDATLADAEKIRKRFVEIIFK